MRHEKNPQDSSSSRQTFCALAIAKFFDFSFRTGRRKYYGREKFSTDPAEKISCEVRLIGSQ